MFYDLYKKFIECAERKCGIIKDSSSKIIAAVSGGADSVCLLLLLCEYYGNDRIICVHFNHNIRGKEAVRDALFTEKLAKGLNVEFVLGEGNVPEYAAANNMGTEEAARFLRYNFFQSVASNKDADSVIAVAHNSGDRAETVLHNIARGTSIDGLKGIDYKRENIVRPILDFSREEIEYICSHYGIDPVFDSTNTDNHYTRNKIRNDVLPYMESVFGKSFRDHIIGLSKSAALDAEYLHMMTQKAFAECCTEVKLPFNKIQVDKKSYGNLHDAIKKRLIRYILSLVKDSRGNVIFPGFTGIYSDMIERAHLAMFDLKQGRLAEISSDVICVCDYGKIYFTHKSCIQRNSYIKAEINVRKTDMCYNEALAIMSQKNVEIFNADVLYNKYGENFEIKLRFSEDGDRFIPFGAQGGKSLRKIFIDMKISRFERDFLHVVAINNDVLWIPGIRRSNIAAIDKNTSRVIIIEYNANTEVHL